MVELKRQSAARFEATAAETETRDNWTVALEYENEGDGPWISDLSHKARWDLQDRFIDKLAPCDISVPSAPGACVLKDGVLINRMNKTQASVWHLGVEPSEFPEHPGYTDVTEATVFIALFGPNVFRTAEKLSALDFMDPFKSAPFLLQGPFCRIPCQAVALERNNDGSGTLLLTCSRGYAQSMVDAILSSGAEFGLSPSGERRFARYVKVLRNK